MLIQLAIFTGSATQTNLTDDSIDDADKSVVVINDSYASNLIQTLGVISLSKEIYSQALKTSEKRYHSELSSSCDELDISVASDPSKMTTCSHQNLSQQNQLETQAMTSTFCQPASVITTSNHESNLKRIKQPLRKGEKRPRLDMTQVPKFDYQPLSCLTISPGRNSKKREETRPQMKTTNYDRRNSNQYVDSREFFIEECDSSPEDSAEKSCMENRQISPQTKALLDTQNSVFLSSQLQTAMVEGLNRGRLDDGNIKTTNQASEPLCLNNSTVKTFDDLARLRPELRVTLIPKTPRNPLNKIQTKNTSEEIIAHITINDETVIDIEKSMTENIQPVEVEQSARLPSTTSMNVIAKPKSLAVLPVTLYQAPASQNNINSNFEFINYIDIKSVDVHLMGPIDARYDIGSQYNEWTTKINCSKCITINGHETKKLLKFNDTEWNAVKELINILRNFSYCAWRPVSNTDNIMSHTLNLLFKSSSGFTTAVVRENNEHEYEVHNIVDELPISFDNGINITDLIDPFVLCQMKIDVAKQSNIN